MAYKPAFHVYSVMLNSFFYARGLQTTGRETISFGPRSQFVNDGKTIYSTYEKIVNLVEYNISRNNHIA